MKDELNQYERMEEQLRLEFSKFEASYEPDDWMLMEEKLDKAGTSYFAFIHHPYFRMAAAAIFLLSSLYGIEALIKPYFSYSSDSGIYTTLPVDNNREKDITTLDFRGENDQEAQKEEGNDIALGDSKMVEIEGNEGDLHAVDASNSNLLASFSNNDLIWTQKPSLYGGKIRDEGSGIDPNYPKQDNIGGETAATSAERDLSTLLTLPLKKMAYINMISTRTRRISGKRTIKTKITHSSTPIPNVVKKNVGRVSIGLYGSADLNFLDFSTGMEGGTSSGVEVKIKSKKNEKLALVTGVGYSHKKFKTKDVPNNPMMSFLNTEVFGDPSNKTVTNTFVSEMEMVEIPVQVQYTMGKQAKKVQPYVEAGITAYIPISQHYTYQSSSNWDRLYESSIAPNPDQAVGYISEANVGLEINGEYENVSNKPYLGVANLNAGVNLQLSERINVHLEGQVKSSVVNHKLDRSIPEREIDFGGSSLSENNFNNRKGLHTLGLQLGVSCAL